MYEKARFLRTDELFENLFSRFYNCDLQNFPFVIKLYTNKKEQEQMIELKQIDEETIKQTSINSKTQIGKRLFEEETPPLYFDKEQNARLNNITNETPYYILFKKEVVGFITSQTCNIGDRAGVKIGYYIFCSFRRKGYATEAVNLLCKIFYRDGYTGVIWAKTDAKNIASIRVLEKAGFVLNVAIGNGEKELFFIKES